MIVQTSKGIFNITETPNSDNYTKLTFLTEDEAEKIVDNHYWDGFEYFKDYTHIDSVFRFCFSALESLETLTNSLNINFNKAYIK